MIDMGDMIRAEGIEAIFEGHSKSQSKTYTYTRPIEFWHSDGDSRPQGMYLDDRGELLYASSFTNFKGYRKLDTAPVVAAIPAGDLYAVYREDGGSLTRMPVPVILIHADGALTMRDFDADGMSDTPDSMANFIGYWRKAWGEEPINWQPKQGTFFEASGGSPPETGK